RAYLLSFLFLALGLMSKAMLVTWPFVMLLLDYWPLGRFEPRKVGQLLLEKIPFFALVPASCAAALVAGTRGGTVASLHAVPLMTCIGNVLVSYCRYFGKVFWPAHLCIFYPMKHWTAATVVAAAVLLAGITGVAFVMRRRSPYLLLGWL